jgi:hypothetical protein
MHLGDRTGTIFRVNGIGEEKIWADVEPQFRISPCFWTRRRAVCHGQPLRASIPFVESTRREKSTSSTKDWPPQGLAFDTEGNLYVAASLRGRRGIVRISQDGTRADLVVAGVNLVGLAFSAQGEMAVLLSTRSTACQCMFGEHFCPDKEQ